MWGPLSDPLAAIHLCATWSSAALSSITDNAVFSSFRPESAERWDARVVWEPRSRVDRVPLTPSRGAAPPGGVQGSLEDCPLAAVQDCLTRALRDSIERERDASGVSVAASASMSDLGRPVAKRDGRRRRSDAGHGSGSDSGAGSSDDDDDEEEEEHASRVRHLPPGARTAEAVGAALGSLALTLVRPSQRAPSPTTSDACLRV